jgi:hypothetical protein
MVSRSPSKADKPKQLPHNLSSSGLQSNRVFEFNKHGHVSNDPKYKWQNRVGSQGKTLSKNNIQEKSGGSFSDVFKKSKNKHIKGIDSKRILIKNQITDLQLVKKKEQIFLAQEFFGKNFLILLRELLPLANIFQHLKNTKLPNLERLI